MRQTFTGIYENNLWKGDESVSGKGSSLEQTEAVRRALPGLLRRFGIRSLLDIPCGDLNWISTVDFGDTQYIGADIVPELVAEAGLAHMADLRVLDITRDALPVVDLVLCRDLLGHFSNRDVKLALHNIRLSGAKFLLSTTFPGRENTHDIETGQWRPINLASLFGLPNPILLINENCTAGDGQFSDKSLGLWRLR